ncbi:TPA: ANR family transcriptional regulator [Vibrio metschnikovii]|uniref:ANR family transcriptional regulator n=1 Tax=Vibrio sp. A14(2019) TaxID=2591428 RepID=UPI0027D3214D|nr:ANR family transcriptional regulator [Vibrio sp. A14(2019)]
MTENADYKEAAEAAAEAERNNRWKTAAALWMNAYFQARKDLNANWANNRSEYCIKRYKEARHA